MTLKRDICVDYNNYLMESTYFVERGWANPETDLVFNSENQAYSQVKTNQTPLYDETGCPWVVGFIPRDTGAKSLTTTAYATADMEVNGLSNWEYWQYVGSNPSHTYLKGTNQVTTCPIRWNIEVAVRTNVGGTVHRRILDMPINLVNKTAFSSPTTTENKNYVWPSSVFEYQSVSNGVIHREFESDKDNDTYFYNNCASTYGVTLTANAMSSQLVNPICQQR